MNAPVPMLVAEYNPHETRWPVLVQPKLDGFRCLARFEGDAWVLYSRRGNVLRLPHITDALITSETPRDVVLDGELYVHGWSFQRLQAAITRTSFLYSANQNQVEFHVFDAFRPDDGLKVAEVRQLWLQGFAMNFPVCRVNSHLIHTQHQLERIYAETIAAGYEGLIVRDPEMRYEHKRSWAVQKLKPHQDAEFLVVGYHRTEKSHVVVLTLRNDINGATFDVPYPGIVHEPEEYLDRHLTVRFNGRTDGGIPRFAVALRLRPEQDIDPVRGGA